MVQLSAEQDKPRDEERMLIAMAVVGMVTKFVPDESEGADNGSAAYEATMVGDLVVVDELVEDVVGLGPSLDVGITLQFLPSPDEDWYPKLQVQTPLEQVEKSPQLMPWQRSIGLQFLPSPDDEV